MTPHRFRWARLYHVLQEDPTTMLEFFVTISYVLLQGLFLASGQTKVPDQVVEWLSWRGFSSQWFGVILIFLALLQLWSSGTLLYNFRGWVAFFIGFIALAVAMAYWFANVTDRFVFPFLLGTIMVEGFLTARDWHQASELRKISRDPGKPTHVRIS